MNLAGYVAIPFNILSITISTFFLYVANFVVVRICVVASYVLQLCSYLVSLQLHVYFVAIRR